MKKVVAIGEALIDFIPSRKNCALKEVPSFQRVCGGAPANVAAACGILGANAKMITKLGNDAFGDYICDTLSSCGVDISSIKRTDKANTALAFVSLKSDGQREFSFYRKPSADMLLEPEDICEDDLKDTGFLHFCSVDLIEAPVKYAHIKAIEYVKSHGGLISFDPNIRLNLWDDREKCKETVNKFIPYADILKISDEEIDFITGGMEINEAFKSFFDRGVSLILYSMGKKGAKVVTKNLEINVPNVDVPVIDTTGAGDSIIGAFLFEMAKYDITDIDNMSESRLKQFLWFANLYSNYTVTGSGAIGSYPDYPTFKRFQSEQGQP